MKEILIDKQIGGDWLEEGITADFVRNELYAAGNEDIKLVIDSLGGDVFDCISIYNTIRDFCRSHSNKITTYIRGIAASAASVIALAASDANKENKIIVEKNSIYMIHNGLTFCAGNRHDLRATADRVEKVADKMMLDIYVNRTGKNAREIEKMMDVETWLCGQEIIDAGFADELITDEASAADVPASIDSTALVASAKSFYHSAKIAVLNSWQRLQIAASIKQEATGNASGEPCKNKMEVRMTAEEFKKSNPEAYAEIVANAKTDGEKTERERASRLLAMGEKCGCTDYALECIRENRNPSDENVIDAFMDKKIAASVLESQKADAAIPNITPPKDAGANDEEAVMAAFNREFGRNA